MIVEDNINSDVTVIVILINIKIKIKNFIEILKLLYERKTIETYRGNFMNFGEKYIHIVKFIQQKNFSVKEKKS